MSILFACPACNAQFLVTKQATGHRVRCPSCDQLVLVAGESEMPAPVSPLVPLPPGTVPAGGEATPPPVIAPPKKKKKTAPPAEPSPLIPLGSTATMASIDAPHLSLKERFLGSPETAEPQANLDKPRKSFSLGAKREAIQAEMDMTPMVDVTFLLLIFFMVTASFTLQRSQQIPKQQSQESSSQVRTPEELSENPDYITVRIDSNNTFYVSAPTMDDEAEVPSRQELLLKLKQARQPDAQGRMPTKLLVKAHGDAMLERVSMAIDAGNDVGIEEVQLLKVEDDES